MFSCKKKATFVNFNIIIIISNISILYNFGVSICKYCISIFNKISYKIQKCYFDYKYKKILHLAISDI